MALFQAENVRVEPQTEGIAFLWLDVPGRSVNVLSGQMLADLDAALDRVAAEASIRLLIVRSAKPAGFLAGADLHEFTAVQSGADATALSERGQRLFDKVESLRVPTLAVIHGACLGGGLELALACDYRLVLDQPSTQIGLPEIELGLLPGWGGTQRLPQIVGLERALQMILLRRRLSARDARRWGLADEVLPKEPATPKEWAICLPFFPEKKRDRPKLPLRNWRQRLLESNVLGRRLLFGGFERALQKRVPDDMPAPQEALQAVREGMAHGKESGLRYEREAIGRLAITSACHNLVNLFFQREKARKAPGETAAKVRRVGIVGAGTMGAGIAQLAALRGCQVTIQEVNAEALKAGTLRIAALFHKAAERGLLSQAEAQTKLAAIKGTLTWEGFREVDLVVEAALEDLEVKRKLFHDLEQHTQLTTILATNTSSLAVKALQEGLAHPERVAALHFFNPVHKMELVEVARTPQTDERTRRQLVQWAIGLGKTPVVVRDSPGFVVNRILVPYLNEAVLLVGEGMPLPRIDQTMVRFGMPMGPLELLDQVGLDVAAHIARSMQPTLGERFAPNAAFAQLCEKGWLGQKSKVGFYRYLGSRKIVNADAVAALHAGTSAGASLLAALPPAAQMQQARERLVLGMVNEAAACLGEGLAADADTIDLAMVLGTGWAPQRGGPLHYGAERGYAEVVQALTEMAGRLGPRFEPCAELRRLAGA